MRNARAALALAALAAVPALALAQQAGPAPKHEWGVDLVVQYSKPSGSDGFFHLGAPMFNAEYDMMMMPVAFRLGFLSDRATSFETRLGAGLVSTTGSGGHTYYNLNPGLNVIRRISGKLPNHNTYLTAGASVALVGATGGTTSETYALVAINAGIGLRRAWGANASRAELFVAYSLENSHAGMPKLVHFGLRLGASLLR